MPTAKSGKPGSAELADTVNMIDEALLKDPFRGYARIRERGRPARGVMSSGDPMWLVTSYDDVKALLSDPRFVTSPADVPGTDAPNLRAQELAAGGVPPEYVDYMLTSIFELNGAEHVGLRGLVSQAFTVRRVAKMRPRIEEFADMLLDRLPAAAEDGVVDLLPHFAYPLSGLVICELVGVPEENRDRWREWARAIWSVSPQGKTEAWHSVVAYTRELIEQRRAQPADDLISGLIRAQSHDGVGRQGRGGGDKLSDVEIITMVLVLVNTGHQTTAHLIGNGTAALLTHPRQLALLRENSDLMPRAVHELMRWCAPTHMAHIRYATEDTEIGGMPVCKGDAVMPVLAGANYDPHVFDDPERFAIKRAPAGRIENHVGFGYGPHYCLGAALARQEAEVAFTALLHRFPGLALAVDPDELEREPLRGHWRLAALPVRL
jgi:cytochrome P450